MLAGGEKAKVASKKTPKTFLYSYLIDELGLARWEHKNGKKGVFKAEGEKLAFDPAIKIGGQDYNKITVHAKGTAPFLLAF